MSGKTHTFGLPDRLRAARVGAGLDQSELAETMGISRGSVHNYEVGATTPRRPVLTAWATATGYDLHWLESGDEPAHKVALRRRTAARAPALVGVW